MCPTTGERYQFLTSENTLPPGIIARLYKIRWDSEKVFDEVKITCRENKSWGNSPETKEAQAQFICIAHQLKVLLEDRLATDHHISNERAAARTQRWTDALRVLADTAQPNIAPMYRQITSMS